MIEKQISQRIENIIRPIAVDLREDEIEFFINHIIINIEEAVYTYKLLNR